MAKYLDENGVATLWERIQQLIYQCCNCEGGGGSGDASALTDADIEEATPIGCFDYTLGCEYYGSVTGTAHLPFS